MNLIIDCGNTFVKIAVFQDFKLLSMQRVYSKDVLKVIQTLINKYPEINKGIVSSVSDLNIESLNTLKEYYSILELNSDTKLPFINKYATPKTLGVDRLALVSAACYKYPKKNVLIIDAGTCITYDFINEKNEYLGGAISLGIEMRYKSLNEFTSRLPKLQTQQPVEIYGNSTEKSIHNGVVYGTVNEIDGFIERFKIKNNDLTVILTGGDAKFLSNQLKNTIFANSNFLLEGLNHILEINSK